MCALRLWSVNQLWWRVKRENNQRKSSDPLRNVSLCFNDLQICHFKRVAQKNLELLKKTRRYLIKSVKLRKYFYSDPFWYSHWGSSLHICHVFSPAFFMQLPLPALFFYRVCSQRIPWEISHRHHCQFCQQEHNSWGQGGRDQWRGFYFQPEILPGAQGGDRWVWDKCRSKRISQHASLALSLSLGDPVLSKYAPVFRHRLGEHSVLQRQYALFCHDSEEAESAGQRGHHKCESTNMVSMYFVSIPSEWKRGRTSTIRNGIKFSAELF